MRSKVIGTFIVVLTLLITGGYFYFPQQNSSLGANDLLTKIVIVGPKLDATAKQLHEMVVALPLKNTEIIWWDRKEGPLKDSLIQYPQLDKAAVYVCRAKECSLPLFEAEEITEFVEHLENKKINPAENKMSMTERLLSNGSWVLTILGFIGVGLLLSFSPCILPLIPIMASIIVGQTIGVKKSRTFLLCLAYVLSMSFTYALLGLLIGMFGWYLQIYMQQTWIIITFGFVFFMLALSMLGAYELKLPQLFLNKLHHHSNQQQGGTFLGVIVMGVLATLIVSPCVTAPLAAIISYITQSSDYILGAVSLFFMGIGMGLPLLIISLFSNNILPKVSHWDVPIKNFFGLLLLGMSIWTVSRIIPEELIYFLWAALAILVSVYMGIFKRRTVGLASKVWKTLTIMMLLLGVTMFFKAFIINSPIDKALTETSSSSTIHNERQELLSFKTIKNLADLDESIKIAKMSRTLVLLDFTAEWCVACVKMERFVFVDPSIQPLLAQFMLLRVDLTEADAESIKVARKFHIVGPPAILFFDTSGVLLSTRAIGEYNVQELSNVLQSILTSEQ